MTNPVRDVGDCLVEVVGLGRDYGRRHALHGINMQVPAGHIMALAGPNGSGKTTLLKLLAGLLRPTFGTVRVFGIDPFRGRTQVMCGAQFAFAPPPLYDTLTAREHLQFLSAAGRKRRKRPGSSEMDWSLQIVGLMDRADDKVRTFSFGMRQRLALAQSLVPIPRLLVLDEPTDGLDPMAILDLRHILKRLHNEHGMTIILSSHLLIELEYLADELLVLHEGNVLFSGPPSQLQCDGGQLLLQIDGDIEVAKAVLRARGLNPTVDHGKQLKLPLGCITLEEAFCLLKTDGIVLVEYHEQHPTLGAALLMRLRQV